KFGELTPDVAREELTEWDKRVFFDLGGEANDAAGFIGSKRNQLGRNLLFRHSLAHAAGSNSDEPKVIFAGLEAGQFDKAAAEREHSCPLAGLAIFPHKLDNLRNIDGR